MHIFIDTNIFEQDPFWKNSFTKPLLDKAKEKRLNLYMSDVVYEELKRHTIKNYKKAHKANIATIIEQNKFVPENLLLLQKVNIEREFIAFYEKLKKEHNLKILNFKNEFFPKVMDRAINRLKPFNDERTDVKDCTIWLTYADYIETKNLRDCYLLTNNSKDFYNKTTLSEDPTEYEIHDDLKKDTTRFRGFPSAKDFFKLILEPQIQAIGQFKEWLDKTNIDAVYVFDLLKENESNKIDSAINKIVDGLEVDKVFNENDWYFSGDCQVNEIDWVDCEEVEVAKLEDSCIVTSILNINVSIEGHAYNPVHDDSDDKYSYLGEKDLQIKVHVSFTLKKNGDYDFVEIDDMEIESE